MPNGNGTATGGFFNYWDRDYTGNGSVAPISAPHTNDGEALSGGLGDLTDGVIATQDWFSSNLWPVTGRMSVGRISTRGSRFILRQA